MFSLLGRAAVRSPFVFGSTARAALPHFNVLPLVAAAGVISVLAQPPEAAECMGKRKKKDSVLEDDMYEVDYIKARKLEKGKPLYLIRWKGFDDDKYDTCTRPYTRPASSAGVERMFSKAGKLYDDVKKGQNDDKLEAALFASANTE